MGNRKAIAILSGFVLALVGVGLWFVLGEVDPTDTRDGGGDRTSDTGGGGGVPGDHGSGSGPRRGRTGSASASVRGIVKTRADRRPAAKQVVTASIDGGESVTALTDELGAFRIEGLPVKTATEVRTSGSGFATVRLPGLSLGRGEDRDIGVLWLDQASRVTVTVRTIGDLPVEGARVEAFSQPSFDEEAWDLSKWLSQAAAVPVPVTSRTTDAQGRATFEETAGGNWSFTAAKAGWSRASSSQVEVEGGRALDDVTIRLRPGHGVVGRVVSDSGAPLTGIQVVAGRIGGTWDTAEQAAWIRTVSGADGTFRFEGLDASDWSLKLARPGEIPANAATIRVPGVSRIELVLRTGGRLHGRVTDTKTGAGIEGVVVTAAAWSWETQFAQSVTDAEGRYAIDPLPHPQVNSLTIAKEGWVLDRSGEPAAATEVVHVPAGESTARDLRVVLGGSVTAAVRGPAGPAAGAKLTLIVATQSEGQRASYSEIADASGRATFRGVEEGTGVLLASLPGHSQKDLTDGGWWGALQSREEHAWAGPVGPGKSAELTAEVAPGRRLTGTVTGPDGPIEGAQVRVSGSPYVRSGADGSFVVEGVAPAEAVVIAALKTGWLLAENPPCSVPAEGDVPPVEVKLVHQALVRGKVISASGAPLVDASVAFVQKLAIAEGPFWRPDFMGEARTWNPVRADGSFEFPLPIASGSFVVEARAQDHATAESAVVEIQAERPEFEANVTLDTGHVVRGRVVCGGAGVPAAQVGLHPAAHRSGGPIIWGPGGDLGDQGFGGTVVAIADSEGLFEIVHVAAGSYTAAAHADGHVRRTTDTFAVPGSPALTIDLERETEIAGRVTTADGKPVAQVSVTASRAAAATTADENVPGPSGQATTSADGRFRIRGLSSGAYAVRAEREWNSAANVLSRSIENVRAPVSDLSIVLDAGAVIAGRVRDEQGRGIPTCWVSAQTDTSARSESSEDAPDEELASSQMQASADGTFRLVGLPPGTYVVSAQTWGTGNGSALMPAEKKGVAAGTMNVELVLSAGLSISGRVTAPDGKPLASVQVQANPVQSGDETEGNSTTWGQSGRTDAAGAFTIGGLGAGKYRLVIAQSSPPPKYPLLDGADSVTAGTTGLELRASEGLSVSGIVVRSDGTPIVGASVTATISDGQEGRWAQSGAGGRFEIRGLRDGAVEISANFESLLPKQLTADAGTAQLRIELIAGRTITGTLLDAGGRPVANAHIQGSIPEQELGTAAQTDANGRFTMQSVPPGELRIIAYVPKNKDGEGAMEPHDLGAIDAHATDVTLRLTK